MKKIVSKLFIAVLITSFVTSCNNDDNNESTQGTVKTVITDDPFPFDFVAEANVSVAKIELKNENGDYVTIFEGNAEYNMVGLTNGVTADVNTTSIENGTYNEARITLSGASVQLTNNDNFDLNTQASGTTTVSIDPALVVGSSQDAQLLLDLDINDSFQFTGFGGLPILGWISSLASIEGCDFEANFSAADLNLASTVTGTVVNAAGEVQVDAEVILLGGFSLTQMTTQTDANGNFTFIGVPNGLCTLAANSSDGGYGNINLTLSESQTATCSITIN